MSSWGWVRDEPPQQGLSPQNPATRAGVWNEPRALRRGRHIPLPTGGTGDPANIDASDPDATLRPTSRKGSSMIFVIRSLAVGTALAGSVLAQDPSHREVPPPSVDRGETVSPVSSVTPQIEIPGLQALKIGGQYRLRWENLLDFDFDGDRTDDNDFFGQRVRLDFDFTVHERLGAFVQVQDARFFGESGSTVSRASAGLDFHQGYLRVHDMPWTGGDVRLGRQELNYGDARLVGSLDWATQARAFDGGRWRWQPTEKSDLDLFVTQLREDRSTLNRHDDALFFGLYWAARCEEGALDAYVLGLNDSFTGTGGNENRLTLGARAVRGFGALELGAELATQTGDVDDADIPFGETFGAHLHGTWRFEGRIKPYLRADIDAASGNDPASGDNERFDTLFPTAHAHLGQMDLAFWENVVHASLAFGFEPCESSKLEASWRSFRAMEDADFVSGPNGFLSSGGAGIDSELGHEFDLKFRIDIDVKPARSHVEAGYGLFLPGQGVEDSRGSDDPAHFIYLQGDLRF